MRRPSGLPLMADFALKDYALPDMADRKSVV